MKRKHYLIIAIAAVIIIAIVIITTGKEKINDQLIVKAQKGEFEILVTVTGELQAKSSIDITGPAELGNSRDLRIREIKIQDLVPEGTLVDSGQYVGDLDRSEVSISLKDLKDELEKAESQYIKIQLDTTMQLRELRDQLVNLKFAMEEKQIVLDQSKFEPPATIRQAKIDLDKSERAYDQAEKNYSLKQQQSRADMREAVINFEKAKRKVIELEKVIGKFRIYAPASGMVIYKKEWDGQKRKVGSTINPWDMSIATLPDLSSMSSKTFVNEIDISKVKSGQQVRIGIDAFPEKKYTGKVLEVANIGEQLPNTDAKVFEVLVNVDQTDSILRPSMTTSNQIITDVFKEVVYLPLEAIHNNDSLSFVYTTSNRKQIIVPGLSNENHIIIEQGLAEGDEVYLSVPDEEEKWKYAGLELIPIIRERENQKKLDEQRKQEQAEERKLMKMNGRKNGTPAFKKD
ncbi:MAG: efflux RND transporter periplasmic adaptor subunit [Bacteroidales bacterium]